MAKETVFQVTAHHDTDHVCAEIVPIFSHLVHEELLEISKLIHHQSFKKGNLVRTPDDQELVILNQGNLKIYQLSASGKEQLLRVMGPGDFEGEAALFGVKTPDTYIQALTDSSACVIYKADFQQLLLDYPTIGLKLLEESAGKIAALEKQAAFLSTDSIQSRLASYLLDLAEANETTAVEIPMKMKELANFIGTTPETLSRTLKKMAKLNILTYQRKQVQILDEDKLEDLIS
ncbi:Crp/Fnr family transcriptional regulator [Agrilactobacillus yilanensis]|uniref:Crp/Fnr family transcriptional regulator n=1 Tax=Agrilactobacillus yilanensis TaxID=2485997 RepID=A0ABW4J8X2_9LACO|nr:Crp/Fnr family transcriptional regulator [Agrilactobacillus yilanensis]